MKRRNKAVDRALVALRRGDRSLSGIEVLANGAFASHKLPHRQVSALFAALAKLAMDRGEEEPMRRGALYGVRGFFDRRSARVMLRILSHREEPPILRAEAAEGLGATLRAPKDGVTDPWLGSVSTVLGNCLSDPSVDIRFWATYSIGMLRLSEHRPKLELLAQDAAVADGFWSVAVESADVLAVLDGREWPLRRRTP